MTSSEIDTFMLAVAGKGMAPGAIVRDFRHDLYALPAWDWLDKDFSAALLLDQERLGIREYVGATNNCTDFALHAMSLARIMNAHAQQVASDCFGDFGYIKTQGLDVPGGHRINFAILPMSAIPSAYPAANDGTRGLVLYEPQLPGIVALTQEELDSMHCFHV